ncbi:tRNA glutamyl-Q(34) synthetase GluQRS [Polynucleobacter sp. JS-Safj-400b-B2]|uniref:tRNA glutamyl-Q(34) synthetase GluQRS n=1 Tax=Polynucleobacter sp. JS-Safj-400b-B2 TaxID=2576921 RepID=UPI001C0B5959|nr:tRNA glutamyl-Q(34) synthetase GluQRS [Polynucleobacter sp. JS-Safj-400b-B2]MBU3626167.1 tRNA glutamyl-Q(34) synthetase GluQRS [Polynucleobacter sp. JS-Safj-400b-B2]
MILAVSKLKNPSSPAGGYRGRFAPSPTGPLHAGSLVAALGSWLDARKNGGKWLLRIEDLDTPRCIPEVTQQIQSQLLACGLSWDEEVIHQSQHHEAYLKALERLNGLECLYSCTCSRQMIANTLASLGIDTPRNQEMVYPGTCRPASLMSNGVETVKSLQKAWRMALPQNCLIEFEDLALGPQSQNLNTEVGDFVLRRSDGLFTYQLAVVVDDAEQGITHIVRGQDLLSNTARQIYLQGLLGYERPKYLHLPLVLDEHGEKLSKQTLATQINTQDQKHSLLELRKAAKHLGLKNLPDGENVTIAEWLLAATHAWRS